MAGIAIMEKLAFEMEAGTDVFPVELSLVIVALLDTADNLSTDLVINLLGLWWDQVDEVKGYLEAQDLDEREASR